MFCKKLFVLLCMGKKLKPLFVYGSRRVASIGFEHCLPYTLSTKRQRHTSQPSIRLLPPYRAEAGDNADTWQVSTVSVICYWCKALWVSRRESCGRGSCYLPVLFQAYLCPATAQKNYRRIVKQFHKITY